MKRIAMVLIVLGLGTFMAGCGGPAQEPAPSAPAVGGADDASVDAGAAEGSDTAQDAGSGEK